MKAYYNENDPKAAAWLRELIKGGHIAHGEVDERSIADVQATDLAGFGQHHFFAGIGGWSYALRLAGWPDDRPVWTGSCPCQPFSVAGKGLGTADKRHLWPEFARLIGECRPARVFGEQVASKDGRLWLTGVRVDLEGMGYAVGAADLCAAGAGAPHIRQRLYWVADSDSERRAREHALLQREESGRDAETIPEVARRSTSGGLALANGGKPSDGDLQRSGQHGQQPQDGGVGGMGHANRDGTQRTRAGECVADAAGAARRRGPADEPRSQGRSERLDEHADQRTAWSASDVIHCTDGKSRRVESGTFPLAHGIPARMGRLRGYGNAIVPQVAAEFVRACQ